MAGKDRINMSMEELRRSHLVDQILGGRLKQVEAAERIGVSDRQLRRMVKRVRQEGVIGLVHRSRGQRSNRAIDGKLKARAVRRYQRDYIGFGPTLASEKLKERDGIEISDETLRLWLRAEGIPYPMRKKRPHRQWRERKPHCGEMIQMDGSHHRWFEDRGPTCVLMGYIDDATGRVFARFDAYEGTLPALDSFKRYAKQHGIPLCVYLDKHTTYKSPGKPTIEEELQGLRPMSQFERSLAELGVKVLHAHSPQAKGRIERLFGTFQDRLIKEMRLAKIKTMEEGNRFLQRYLPIYNRRFAVLPAQPANLHRPIPRGCDLDRILCVKTFRVLRNDFTVAHHGKLYQIKTSTRARRVLMEERVNGTLWITDQGQRLRYREITTRPIRLRETPRAVLKSRRWKPAADNPWRQFVIHPPQKSSESSLV